MTAPRGLRNNNPGNIRKGSQKWQGEVAGDDPDFCLFDCPENGIRALARTLLTYYRKHGLNTVRGIIHRWAPPAENDTGSYCLSVAQTLKVQTTTPLRLEDPKVLAALVSAIIRHENGQMPYAEVTVAEGVKRALA